MAATVLKPEKLKPRVEVSEEIKQLAREAKVVLRHEDLADRVLDGRPRLADVLRKLEMEIIPWSQVKQYREEKQKAINLAEKGYHYWHETDIKSAKNVPPFVLRKAIQLKLACPEVKLLVESLDNDPDPFLEATMDGDTYYIEVWDESDFEKELGR